MEPRNGAMSVFLSSQEEEGVCKQRKLRMSLLEQWEKRQVLQKLGTSASETFQMIKQTYSEEALGCSAVFKWHKRFAQGREF
jgi:hypothetical protein